MKLLQRPPRRAYAFTLVELLVVIGIIAALIGILLPVLSGVSARGRDIKCQSNLRQIVQAIHGYATENKGSMPYGLYFETSHPTTWEPYGSGRFVSWASLVGKYMVKGADGDNGRENFPPVLTCPEAQSTFPHVVSYVMNMIVAIAPYYELVVAQPPGAQLKPPVITLMLPDTALVWDTAVQPGWANSVGYLLGADIDGQRFWSGAVSPHMRYFSRNDPFAQIPPGTYGNNKPVNLNVGSWQWRNIDPGQEDTHYPYQGNLRFRHAKGTACNVGFADGSVRQIRGKFTPAGAVRQHDGLRRYFMIKWPIGVPADRSLPH